MTRRFTDSSLKRHLMVFLFYLALIFISYSNALNGTWAMDDILLNKPVEINDIRGLIGFRKVTYLTFLINQSVMSFSPAGFRVFNILLHTVNTILVYIIAFKTTIFYLSKKEETSKDLKRKGKNLSINNDKAFAVALLSGVVFGLHPININAVTYIIQRMAGLSAFFCFLSLLSYIAAYQSKGKSKRFIFYLLCGILIAVGILAKENAIMAIPLILLYDFIFLSRFDSKTFLRRVSLFLVIGIVSAITAAYFLKLHYAIIDLAGFLVNPNKPLTSKGWMSVDVYWTPLQHILTEFRVVSRYIFLLFVPLPRFFIFDWWGYPVSRDILTPLSTLLSFIFVVSLLSFSILKMKRFPLLSFAILWYLIAVSLESFFALGSDLYFEHRNYLPVSGLFIGIIGQIIHSFKNVKIEKIWIFAVILSLTLGSFTFARNLTWKDSISLWKDTLKKAPYNIRAAKAIGNTYLRLYDLKNAEFYFVRALKGGILMKSPQMFDESAFALGILYLYKGELPKAKELIEKYQVTVESYRPHILKGYYDLLREDFDSALSEFDKAKDAGGIYRTILLTLKGDAYRYKGLLNRAMEEYAKAINEDISWAPAYHGIGITYMLKRDIQHAEEYFKRALSVEPDNVLILSDMADLMLIKRRPGEALKYAQAAVSKKPPFYQPYLAMGNALLVMEREKEAERFYREAIDRGAKDHMVILNKARMYYLRGDYKRANEYLSSLGNFKDIPLRMRELIMH